MVEIGCPIQSVKILCALEVVIAAHYSLAAAGTSLKPLIVLSRSAAGGVADGIDGDVLVSAKRCLRVATIGKSLNGSISGGGVQTLQEHLSRVLQDIVDGGSDAHLGEHSNVGGHCVDLMTSIGRNPTVAEVVAGDVDLVSTESSQAGRRPGLCGTISMAVEDVGAQDGLRSSWAEKRQKSKEVLELHLVCV